MRWLLAVAVVAGVAGGSGAFAASPFDGTYRGTSDAIVSNYRCQPQREITIRVVDGSFNYNGGDGTADARITIAVGPDGKFSGQAGQRYLSGQIKGSQLTATSSASRCNYTWSLNRQGG